MNRVSAVDDCFAFSSRRVRHEEAVALLKSLPASSAGTEFVSIFHAANRVSAEEIAAPRSSPAHTNAAVDGYAFAFADYDPGQGAAFPVAGRAAAGTELEGHPAPHTAFRIFTGAIMPEGYDTVAMQEDCQTEREGESHVVRIPAGLKHGANRRLAGEDMKKGSVIVKRGQRFRPQDLAALAAAGRGEVSCFRRPKLCIFSTGNEVLAPGASFETGKVYDANGPMLTGLLAPLGVTIVHGGILPDNRKTVTEMLVSAAQEHDMIITSGGASLGEEDHVVAALREAEALSLWQLAIKPGRPMGVGRIGSCLCLALPGNPVAVFVCALLYAWPLLRRLSGEDWKEPARLTVRAGFEIASRKLGRREFFRGWLEREGEHPVAKKYERDGSGLISSLRASTGLIEIPEDTREIKRGSDVAFIPLSEFGIF